MEVEVNKALGTDKGQTATDSFELSAEEINEEARLMEHNRRFQAAVLENLDQQLQRLQHQIDLRDGQLKWTNASRQDLALALQRVSKELPELRKNLKKTTAALEKTKQANTLATTEIETSDKKISHLEEENQMLKREKNEVQTKLEEMSNANRKMRQLQNAVSDDLRMRHLLQKSLKAEVDQLRSERKVALKELNQWQRKFEEAMCAVRDISCELSAQKHETQLSKTALVRAVDEMDLLANSNQVMIRRWEEAAAAMSDRDAITRELSEGQNESGKRLRIMDVMLDGLESENAAVRKKHEEMEHKLYVAVKKHDVIQHHLAVTDEKKRNVQKRLENTGFAYHQVLSALKQSRHEITQLKAKVALLEKDNAMALASTSQQRQVTENLKLEHASEQLCARREMAGLKEAMSQAELAWKQKVSQLSIDHLKEQTTRMELETQLKELQSERDRLATQLHQADQSYEESIQHNSHLQQDVASSEYRALKAEQREAELKQIANNVEPYVMKIKGLEKELCTVQAELVLVRQAYSMSQNQIVQAGNKSHRVRIANDRIKARSMLDDSLRDRAQTQLDKSQKEGADVALEREEAKLRLHQFEKKFAELSSSNKTLKKQLFEQRLQMETASVEEKKAHDELKHELVALRRQRQGIQHQLQLETKKRLQAEAIVRSIQNEVKVGRNMAASNDKQMHQQRQQIKALKTDRLAGERRFAEWSKKFEKMSKRGMGIMPPIGGERAKRRNSSGKAEEEENRVKILKAEGRILRQLKGELVRCQTESAERLTEIVRLRRQMNSLSQANHEVRTEKTSAEKTLEMTLSQKSALEQKLMVVSNRYLRAESIAGAMESTIKERIPDQAFDFAMKGTPSAQLLDAINSSSGMNDYDSEYEADADVNNEKSLDNFLKEMQFA